MSTTGKTNAALLAELMRRAACGELTPYQVEQEAFPDCDVPVGLQSPELDALAEPAWTHIMALFWIISRDPMEVREVWTKARLAWNHWVGSSLSRSIGSDVEPRVSWKLEPRDPPTASEARAIEEDYEWLLPPIIEVGRKARKLLWDALLSGKLEARGKCHSTGQETTIPMQEWEALDWLEDHSLADTFGDNPSQTPKYHSVKISGKNVREIWAPLEAIQPFEFEREDWSALHAELWVAYRTLSVFHFVGKSNSRARAHFSSITRHDDHASDTILKALMTGNLYAYRNGRQIPPAEWLGKTLPRRESDENRIYFFRSEVLEKYVDQPGNWQRQVAVHLTQLRIDMRKVPSQKNAWEHVRNKGDCKGVTMQFVRKWVKATWGGKQGKRKVDSN